MPGWIHPEYLAVQHMGYPCQGMPVARMHGLQRPSDTIQCETGSNMVILSYIFAVIEVEEFMGMHLLVNSNDGYY